MELVSRCVECGLAEPESLASLGGSAPGVVDGILSTILEGLKEYGYAGMDEGSKTRHLLTRIKTTALDSVKTHILCNAELRQDFEKMCGSIQGLYHAIQGQQAPRAKISSTATKTETEQKKRKPQGRVEERYYTIQEYKALPVNRRRN